jgi:predicted patatin/cPLA2 family phospholipase
MLTEKGDHFIDKTALLRTVGLGLLDLRWENLIGLFMDYMGKPVLNLDYLLDEVVKTKRPLNWEKFWGKQANGEQPLKIIASGLLSKKSVVLSASQGNFKNLEELSTCLKASMLLPGISGPPIQLKGSQIESDSELMKANWTEYETRFRKSISYGSEPLIDAQLFEPIPYRSAIQENCSHILVFRTRSDGLRVTKPMKFYEKMIMRRYFNRKLELPEITEYMLQQGHRKIYAEDVLRLNEESRDFSPYNEEGEEGKKNPKLYCVALPPGRRSVS